MPLLKTNLGAPTKRFPENTEEIHRRILTPNCDPTNLHSNSIEMTLRHGGYSANLPRRILPEHSPTSKPTEG